MTDFFFTSDTHFWHDNIIKYLNRPFSSLEEMNESLVQNWNSVVKRGDLVYHLGDFAITWNKHWQDRVERLVARLNGQIHLIYGNHDREAVRKANCWTWSGSYKKIKIGRQKIILFHYAMRVWDQSTRGSWSLHGHSHGTLPELPHSLSFDVGVDCWNFYPVSFDTIKDKIDAKTLEQES